MKQVHSFLKFLFLFSNFFQKNCVYIRVYEVTRYMKCIINIGNKKEAIRDLEQFKNKHYDSLDIEFTNVHLLRLNDLVGFKLFRKNNLFVHSSTLWDAMQPVGSIHKHHSHGLKPETIFDVLSTLKSATLIYKSYSNRFAVVVCGIIEWIDIMVIIELNSGLINDRYAKINKLVTIYPKDNIVKLINQIDEKDILYKK